MIYYKVNIIIVSGEQERTIQGLCVNPSDIERIIYHKMYSIALQFICDDPYFHDLSDTNIILFDRIDNFPNVIEDGYGYISLPAVATTRMPGKQKLNNKDVVKVYPVIEINNATNETTSSTTIGIIINNYTTGISITIERDMKPGETIIIDLPHRKITSDIDEDVIGYKVYGNSVQDGTPTPETPIEFQSVGNLVTDETSEYYGKYDMPVTVCGKKLLNRQRLI